MKYDMTGRLFNTFVGKWFKSKMTSYGKNIAFKIKIKLLRTNKMFCLRLAWLVVAYPMQVKKFNLGDRSYNRKILLKLLWVLFLSKYPGNWSEFFF
jgi:hypothetical protein